MTHRPAIHRERRSPMRYAFQKSPVIPVLWLSIYPEKRGWMNVQVQMNNRIRMATSEKSKIAL